VSRFILVQRSHFIDLSQLVCWKNCRTGTVEDALPVAGITPLRHARDVSGWHSLPIIRASYLRRGSSSTAVLMLVLYVGTTSYRYW
jgi:hypothetical protein